MSKRITARKALWIVLLLASFTGIGVAQSVESHYDARFPRGCSEQNVSPTIRQQLKSKLRSEFQRVNPTIEAIGILEIKCAENDYGKLIGAVVLAYGRRSK